ncbi:MAG: hypothetical protein WEE89_16720 [Gemmatimonadota bacterium]
MIEPTRLPARPSLEQLRKQAKDLLRAFRSGDARAAERFRGVSARFADASRTTDVNLADAQFVLAREYGFESWARLVHHVDAIQPSDIEPYERLASELATAYTTGDAEAIRALNARNSTSFVWEREPLEMRRRLSTWFASETRSDDLALADARRMVANSVGLESWEELVESIGQPPTDPRSALLGISSTPPFYKVDWKANTIATHGPLPSEKDWDNIFAIMKEHGITGLNAGAQMTDTAVKRLSRLDHVTRLDAGGSNRLTDDGLLQLAHMPQLEYLNLGGWDSPISDRGLEVLRDLPALRDFQAGWSRRISDAGVSNLSFCDRLEVVNLMGSTTGDGAIAALAGKTKLHRFKTGRLVTDAGLPLLHQLPVFKTWHPAEIHYDLMSFAAERNSLMIDGPFTDKGLTSLAGLDGLFGLSIFWHSPAFTANGLAVLADLANLGFLGCQGENCNDAAMRHISAIPRLRMLMAQGTVASDAGFAALSRSQTLEYIWCRECPNLGGPGFEALSTMPALRGLAVSCKNVDDAALSAFPRFPALHELLPMDVKDDGFRHVGGCQQLETLWCMYCRDAGDQATEHIGGLELKTYYAGMTKITDRSLEILGRMATLESVSLYECVGITNVGIAALAKLPNLREVTLEGLAQVSREGSAVFPPHVRVDYA